MDVPSTVIVRTTPGPTFEDAGLDALLLDLELLTALLFSPTRHEVERPRAA